VTFNKLTAVKNVTHTLLRHTVHYFDLDLLLCNCTDNLNEPYCLCYFVIFFKVKSLSLPHLV